MLISKFWSSYDKSKPNILVGIAIDTEKRACKFCEQAKMLKQLWANGDPYNPNDNKWNVYKEESVYLNDGTICSRYYAKNVLDAYVLKYEQIRYIGEE